MTSFFHSKGLGAEVLYYGTDMGKDWLLTSRVRGEDCTLREHLDEPERLCDLLSSALRELHESDSAGCPVQNRNEGYFATVDSGYRRGVFDGSYLLPAISAMNAREAYALTAELRGRFKNDALLHGDYCLPNVMLDGWRVSGFIDLGNGGIGDRHIDMFWGAWTLNFNLKTDKYRDRFFDGYGRESVDDGLLLAVSAAECFA